MAMRILGFMCFLLICSVNSDASVVPAVAESMNRSVLRDIGAHDLAQGVAAIGHRFEHTRRRKLLEDGAAPQQICV
jgi:hypothetical protein